MDREERDARDMQFKGMVNEVKGKAKEIRGKLTDNPEDIIEGRMQQGIGQVENKFGGDVAREERQERREERQEVREERREARRDTIRDQFDL